MLLLVTNKIVQVSQIYAHAICQENRMDGVMISMYVSSVVDRAFEPQSCQTKD